MKVYRNLVFLCVMLGTVWHENSFAQFSPKLYVQLKGGYGFPIASENLPLFWYDGSQTFYPNPVGATTSTVFLQSGSWTALEGSYGQGASMGLDIGFAFNEYISAELGISYLFGTPMKVTSYYEWDSQTYDRASTMMTARMLRLTPSAVLTIGKKRFRPYMKAGLAIGVLGHIEYETDRLIVRESYPVPYGYRSTIRHVWEFSGGVALGFSGAAGVRFNLNERFTFFAELPIIIQSYAPTEGRLTEYIQDGFDRLPTTSASIKEIRFVDELSGEAPIAEVPSEKLTIWHPFSSVGLSVGVQFCFQMKKKEKADD